MRKSNKQRKQPSSQRAFVAAALVFSVFNTALVSANPCDGNVITDAVDGAIIGGVAGAIVGNAGNGAAIGAGAGVIAGAYDEEECARYEREFVEDAMVEDIYQQHLDDEIDAELIYGE
ncbi:MULTISPECIES: glycine zipper family protein [unclassified Agarivorans]|uniref:glycine zipper family protein n=1 Tax=unclassified Agarivorans TaxID=2636026 RepID=UPI0026E2C70B|nr:MULTISPECIES: glycine zipper family protein [unclassified Agarivorans]MDO6684551.1 glycine zipper family protein [Agarivorans sp. 3_MG-2023]MDO6714716.1 glycine zipper family protein [Agarivorans sp. 2_MG-2023]